MYKLYNINTQWQKQNVNKFNFSKYIAEESIQKLVSYNKNKQSNALIKNSLINAADQPTPDKNFINFLSFIYISTFAFIYIYIYKKH
jgi:hypothetical protein